MQGRTITQDEFALLKQYRQLSHAEKIIVKRFLSGLLFDAQKEKIAQRARLDEKRN
ncbi:hypothetical protein [Phascolarctobacterium succinatutens]|uniref:hypothetical protein n=1 Tax=Phascolarctobacterium succinatutens TaxID=626940 RepID=UPI0026700F44|nr:hypothetical protein [Phascolarctobacterium succinatutens]